MFNISDTIQKMMSVTQRGTWAASFDKQFIKTRTSLIFKKKNRVCCFAVYSLNEYVLKWMGWILIE